MTKEIYDYQLFIEKILSQMRTTVNGFFGEGKYGISNWTVFKVLEGTTILQVDVAENIAKAFHDEGAITEEESKALIRCAQRLEDEPKFLRRWRVRLNQAINEQANGLPYDAISNTHDIATHLYSHWTALTGKNIERMNDLSEERIGGLSRSVERLLVLLLETHAVHSIASSHTVPHKRIEDFVKEDSRFIQRYKFLSEKVKDDTTYDRIFASEPICSYYAGDINAALRSAQHLIKGNRLKTGEGLVAAYRIQIACLAKFGEIDAYWAAVSEITDLFERDKRLRTNYDNLYADFCASVTITSQFDSISTPPEIAERYLEKARPFSGSLLPRGWTRYYLAEVRVLVRKLEPPSIIINHAEPLLVYVNNQFNRQNNDLRELLNMYPSVRDTRGYLRQFTHSLTPRPLPKL